MSLAHERGAHRYQPHPLCPACRAEGQVSDVGWVQAAREKRLAPRIIDGRPAL